MPRDTEFQRLVGAAIGVVERDLESMNRCVAGHTLMLQPPAHRG